MISDVSGGHAIRIAGHLIHASVLVNGTTVARTSLAEWQQHNKSIEYFNIELEKHELINAEGILAESYFDCRPRSSWGNYTAYLTLYKQELPIQELPLPLIQFSRQLPKALREKLLEFEVNALAHSPLAVAEA